MRGGMGLRSDVSLRPTRGSGGTGVAQAITTPAGFDYSPPVTIYDDGTTFTTGFNANQWKVPATTDIWISPTGNDTTGTGTQANPYRGIAKAMQVAAAGPDVGYNIYAVAGEYRYTQGFFGQACDRNLNFIAVGGRVLATNKFAITGGWTLDGAGTYKVTRASVTQVRDFAFPITWPNGDQTPQILTKKLTLAECQAEVGTWYTDDVTVWVHLQDGRVPNADANQDVGLIIGANAFLQANARTWFIQGFDSEAGSATCFGARAGIGVEIPQIVFDDCRAWLQTLVTDRAFRLDGVRTAILNNCRAFDSVGDGMGYSRRDGSSPSCNAMEINCRVYDSGDAATTTNVQNASTNHANGRTIRVNCVYDNAYGPVVADINTTKNWMLGCTVGDSLLTTLDSQDSGIQAGNPTGDTTETWLDRCTISGNHFDLYAGTGCTIRHRGTTFTTSGGAGTIAAY